MKGAYYDYRRKINKKTKRNIRIHKKERFMGRTIDIPVTIDSVVRLYTNKVRKKEK